LAAAMLPFMPTAYLFFGVSLAFAGSLAVLLLLPRAGASGSSHDPADAPASAFWSSFVDGLGYLRSERRVFWIWVITVANNFFLMGPVIIGIPIYVKVHLGASASAFAVVEGTYAGGMILSTWAIARFGARWNPNRMMFWGIIYDGLTYLPLLWVTSVEGTVLTILIHSLGIPTITISRITALHLMVPREMQGRVFAYFHLAVSGMTALSIGTVGIVLTWLPVNHLFFIIGILAASCGVFGLAHPVLRRMK
jgi:hypothetical protein